MSKPVKPSKASSSKKSLPLDQEAKNDVTDGQSDISASEQSSVKSQPASFLSTASSGKNFAPGSLFVPGNLELIHSGISLNATNPSNPQNPSNQQNPPATDNADSLHNYPPSRIPKSASTSLSSKQQSQYNASLDQSPSTDFTTKISFATQNSDPSFSIKYNPEKPVDPVHHDGWSGPPYEKDVIVSRTKKRRTVYLIKEMDVMWFDKIARWKTLHPTKTMEEAWDELVSHTPNGRITPLDGIVQLIYGVRRYDYLLKYKKTADTSNDTHRGAFEGKLLKRGMLVEREISLEDPNEVFVKILTPFHVLCTEAQLMKLKMPLKVDEDYLGKVNSVLSQSRSSMAKSYPFFSNIYKSLKPLFEDDLRLDQQTAVFNRNKLSLFEGADPNEYSARHIQSNLFRDSHRSLLTFRIIAGVEILIKGNGTKPRKEGVRHLISEGIYTSMFHLHDDLDDNERQDNLRLLLKRNWAQKYFSYQPLDQISSYFGEKVALYFAFNGFYNLWLVWAVIAGLIVCIYGLGEATNGSSFRWALLFDNTLTPWYGVFNSLWAMLMPSVWNRQANYLSWRWSTYDFEREESKRPEFKATETRKSEITGKNELYFSPIKRRGRQFVSSLVMGLWVAIMAVFISLQISIGAYVTPSINDDIWIACLATIVIMQVPFGIAVRLLNSWENYPTDTTYDDSFILKTYIFDFANSYSQPVYYSIVKPAFLSQNLFGLKYLNDSCTIIAPAEGGQVVDRFQEICIPWIAGRCSNLATVIKRRLRKAKERRKKLATVSPVETKDEEEGCNKILDSVDMDTQVRSGRPSVQKRPNTKSPDTFLFGASVKNITTIMNMDYNTDNSPDDRPERLPQYYRDAKLPEYSGVRDEYAQKIVQFGFVAMFVSINPLAPFFALLNNIYELRADAYKVLIMNQRPIPARAQDIGSWEHILRFTAKMSVATNSIQIAFTSAAFYSTFLNGFETVGARMAARVGFIIVFHYAVYSITSLFHWLVPEVPESVQLAMARTAYLDRLQRDQDVEEEDEFLSNPSLYSERNFSTRDMGKA
ncbi:Anoctamin-7 [Phlyctochytrium planicorne]|nr:Anoctamin-7 [Phlyctochytrium planicorne]